MSLAVLDGVDLAFGGKRIVAGLDLRLAEGDRVGVVGPNGSGKTSLLRILAGEQSTDAGAVRLRKGLRLGYLPQDLEVHGTDTLRRHVLDSVPGRATLDQDLKEAEDELERAGANGGDEDELMTAAARISDIHERIDHFDLHYSEHEALRILAGLGFSTADHDRPLDELSGGWKMRAELAALLFQRPDLLLLDEPTNHLDMPSVAWFGAFLRRYDRAFCLICHDRDFMNEQIARIVSFETEGVRQYKGDYEQYVRQRAEEAEVLRNRARNLAREREKAEQFITRFRAQANKARAVQSRIKALERMEAAEIHQERETMTIRFPPSARAGNEVIRATGVRKAFGDNVVFPGVDIRLMRGEKVGIIGVNGVGKTTLLRMLGGELDPDGGEIVIGHNVKAGYYAQHHADMLDGSHTVFQEVAQMDPSASETRVRTLLGAFLFTGDEVDKSVRVLSGGERARVALARLLIKPGNLLLMDEPTNHLDLESSESLARALGSYDGTLLFVSHNRSFVRQVAAKIWNVEDGRVEPYPGTLDEYLHHCNEGESEPEVRASAPAREVPVESARGRDAEKARKREEAERRARRGKKLGPIERRLKELEQRIEELEVAQKQRSAQLADPEIYADEDRRRELLADYDRDHGKVEELTGRWESALEQLERAQAELGDD